jgi:hypothetical protein
MMNRRVKWMSILTVLFVMGLVSSFVYELTYKLIMMLIAIVGIIYAGWKLMEVIMDEMMGGEDYGR